MILASWRGGEAQAIELTNGIHFGYETCVVPEPAEAATRSWSLAVLARLSERTSVTPTDWVTGIEAPIRAIRSINGIVSILAKQPAVSAIPLPAAESHAQAAR